MHEKLKSYNYYNIYENLTYDANIFIIFKQLSRNLKKYIYRIPISLFPIKKVNDPLFSGKSTIFFCFTNIPVHTK